jgi:hypothetical protein
VKLLYKISHSAQISTFSGSPLFAVTRTDGASELQTRCVGSQGRVINCALALIAPETPAAKHIVTTAVAAVHTGHSTE